MRDPTRVARTEGNRHSTACPGCGGLVRHDWFADGSTVEDDGGTLAVVYTKQRGNCRDLLRYTFRLVRVKRAAGATGAQKARGPRGG